jgi:hypothetical protein
MSGGQGHDRGNFFLPVIPQSMTQCRLANVAAAAAVAVAVVAVGRLVCPVRRVHRDAPVAVTWKLRVTWSFRTCYACFISRYCKVSKIIGWGMT